MKMTHSAPCARARRWLLALCLMNVVPALWVAALGLSGATALGEEHRFSFPSALLFTLLILDLPLLAAWLLLARGYLLGKVLALLAPMVLVGVLIFLLLSLLAAEFLPLFKASCVLLAVSVGVADGWGAYLGYKALLAPTEKPVATQASFGRRPGVG